MMVTLLMLTIEHTRIFKDWDAAVVYQGKCIVDMSVCRKVNIAWKECFIEPIRKVSTIKWMLNSLDANNMYVELLFYPVSTLLEWAFILSASTWETVAVGAARIVSTKSNAVEAMIVNKSVSFMMESEVSKDVAFENDISFYMVWRHGWLTWWSLIAGANGMVQYVVTASWWFSRIFITSFRYYYHILISLLALVHVHIHSNKQTNKH